jgi:chaperonin cofactor prefoldin
MLNQPFFQITLPLMVTLVVAIWSQSRGFDNMNKRLDTLEKRLDKIEAKLDKIEERLKNLEVLKWR